MASVETQATEKTETETETGSVGSCIVQPDVDPPDNYFRESPYPPLSDPYWAPRGTYFLQLGSSMESKAVSDAAADARVDLGFEALAREVDDAVRNKDIRHYSRLREQHPRLPSAMIFLPESTRAVYEYWRDKTRGQIDSGVVSAE